jgi:hypothetical protein
MERLMPRNVAVDRPDRVLVIGTVEDYMTVEHKLWENQLASTRGYDPTYWLVYEEDYGSPTPRARVTTLCIRRGSSASRTPLPFSLVAAECLPPRSASFALMDYKVQAHVYIKKSIQKGHNPLLPSYVGHIGRKPVSEADGPLESMDDILTRTERGAREVTIKEWDKLKGYPSYWGTTAKDRRRIIQEPSLHFWSVLGDAFTPTLIHQENPKLEHTEEDDAIYTSIPPLSPIPPLEEDSSYEESDDEVDHIFPFEWEAPDLKEGGEWCEARLNKLRTITEG